MFQILIQYLLCIDNVLIQLKYLVSPLHKNQEKIKKKLLNDIKSYLFFIITQWIIYMLQAHLSRIGNFKNNMFFGQTLITKKS